MSETKPIISAKDIKADPTQEAIGSWLVTSGGNFAPIAGNFATVGGAVSIGAQTAKLYKEHKEATACFPYVNDADAWLDCDDKGGYIPQLSQVPVDPLVLDFKS